MLQTPFFKLPPRAGLALVLALTLGLMGCGGGGVASNDDQSGSSNDDQYATWMNNPGGVSTFNASAAAYQGTITGLGSIVVNGVRFETTDSSVDDSDDFSVSYDSVSPKYAGAFEVGMTVSLYGDVDDAQALGRANRIRVVGGARGHLEAIDENANTLTLATSQKVLLSSSTTYGGTFNGNGSLTTVTDRASLATLVSQKPLLNVYGMTQSDGQFLATRVTVTQEASHALDVAVRGKITAISGDNYTVNLGPNQDITVVCASGTGGNGCAIQPVGNVAAIGDSVRALATDGTAWNGTNKTLTASRLQLLNPNYVTRFTGAPSAATYTKIKGVATFVNNKWYVSGVEIAAGPTFTSGNFYEVKGTWNGSQLVAGAFELEGSRSSTASNGNSYGYRNELYGAISNLDRTNSTFYVQGMSVNASGAYVEYGSFANLNNGTYVEVKGNLNNGVMQATKIEIKSGSSSSTSLSSSSSASMGVGRTYEIYGLVNGWAGNGQTFSMTRNNGVVTAMTSTSTRFKYGAPTNGQWVEAKGYMDANNVFQVIKLEVKNGDHD